MFNIMSDYEAALQTIPAEGFYCTSEVGAKCQHPDNRNPFIDHPEWVACLFLNECDAECPQDLDGDGSVGAPDLAQVLGAWGMCP